MEQFTRPERRRKQTIFIKIWFIILDLYLIIAFLVKSWILLPESINTHRFTLKDHKTSIRQLRKNVCDCFDMWERTPMSHFLLLRKKNNRYHFLIYDINILQNKSDRKRVTDSSMFILSLGHTLYHTLTQTCGDTSFTHFHHCSWWADVSEASHLPYWTAAVEFCAVTKLNWFRCHNTFTQCNKINTLIINLIII